ncbi:MAG: flagellar hook-associated protein FlgK [Clostridia bacterium]|jgi:flagellar hook-associated protein 1 FlgK|nr:flagellar hook-associated protein FlgK [Clostridia bacterium]
MRSTFSGLNIGASALAAQQRALDVTGHNIANANTQGYSRQSVSMVTTRPIRTYSGFVGTGVQINNITRIRDQFVDAQIRNEINLTGEWETKYDILSKLELIINEPSDNSLRSVLDEYWAAWQQLSKNPESSAVRAAVMQSGITLSDTLNHMSRQFTDLQDDLNNEITVKVTEINSYGRQIRDLNVQIVKAETEGFPANDLRDRRDYLVDQLARIADIGVNEDSVGALQITIGGRALVAREELTEMKCIQNQFDPSRTAIVWLDRSTGNPLGEVSIKGGELKGYLDMLKTTVPQLKEEIDELTRRIATEVNELHRQGYGADKSTGLDFFTRLDDNVPFSAANIRVNQDIIDDITKIAAAITDDPDALAGDGANALLLAQLKSKKAINPGVFSPPLSVTGTTLPATVEISAASGNNRLYVTIDGTTRTLTLADGIYDTTDTTQMDALAADIQAQLDAEFGPLAAAASFSGGRLQISSLGGESHSGIYEISGSAASVLGLKTGYNTTFDDFFRSSVAQLGVITMEAERMTDNQNLLLNQLQNKRETISGVSLDEEMTNMIRYQHAYTAAARLITTMDEMLDLIVNRLGLVGR